jgi:hypothetical protein
METFELALAEVGRAGSRGFGPISLWRYFMGDAFASASFRA